ncbi:tRNA lysidine(34) synthetase TilS [Geobacter pickeringii]|uniref:tRNA(Ile)-lysidine synthase n=1 Tax=Geobacter pickeringii TaxID=345632 RepID=A0A0B5B9A6_9BACT|nr:tRNA lysidine(34) synthetase TilS [Geobacter pickeringii]AJE03147.1 tRNA(Ile)-lysidine synthetase [Geobacter pickeringii]
MKTISSKILAFATEHSLFSPGDTVVVAVSGGPDSVALLDILASLSSLELQLVVAHVNHCLRGAESDEDERFVASLAASYGLPFHGETVDVRDFSRRECLSLEDAGRRCRYAFFDRLAGRCGASSVVLAHHADDQAETLLLRLLRGAGTTGLSAMAPRTAGRYVRPLLALTRHEIERYLRERHLSFRVDSSNADIAFLRNRLRHELLPALAGYNPEISRRLAVTAELLAADEEVLERAVASAFERICHGRGDAGVELDVAALLREPRGIRYRLYRRCVELVKGDLARLAFSHVRQIDDLVRSPRPNLSCTLPEGVNVTRAYGTLVVGPAAVKEEFEGELFVDGPGTFPLPGGGELVVEVGGPPEGVDLPPHAGCFDLARTPFPWLVRGGQPGDRIRPLGMGGSRKVKDIFIDEKVPRELRRNIPLVFSGGELIWVCGYRVAEGGRVTADTVLVARAEVRYRPLK